MKEIGFVILGRLATVNLVWKEAFKLRAVANRQLNEHTILSAVSDWMPRC
jgi:hypothetical protein